MRIRVADPAHPLVAGIDDFVVEDEPYYCEHFGDNHVLLECDYDAPSTAYVRSEFGIDQGPHPQMYLHACGQGVLSQGRIGPVWRTLVRAIADAHEQRICSCYSLALFHSTLNLSRSAEE